MPKPDTKPQSKVAVNIKPGKVTSGQRTVWKKWWAARITEVKQSEANDG
jgi:hypothetical protein